VDVYVRRLRKSITRDDERDVIRTVRVAGYGLDSG
jgi:two-component system, OmpR family, phosphate regulon response regulator PhoB